MKFIEAGLSEAYLAYSTLWYVYTTGAYRAGEGACNSVPVSVYGEI